MDSAQDAAPDLDIPPSKRTAHIREMKYSLGFVSERFMSSN